jgi:hypothetical protein
MPGVQGLLALRTSVPWTCQAALWCEHTLHERRAVMRALGRCGMDLVLHLQQQDLAALYTLNLDFLLLAVLQLEGRDVLELELLRHGSESRAECNPLDINYNRLCLALKL